MLIVLAAGPVTQDFVSVSNVSSPAMLPYMGRPLIYQTIVNHIKQHSGDVIVTIPKGETRLEEFLTLTFGSRLNLILERIDTPEAGTPVTSLQAAVNAAHRHGLEQRPAYIVYGDIYFEPGQTPTHQDAAVFVDDYVGSDKYSYFVADNNGFHHVEGGPGEPASESGSHQSRLFTDVGAYWVPCLQDVAKATAADRENDTVGGLLSRYYLGRLELAKVRVWSDLGHLDTAMQIRTRLIGAREFNSLTIDEERGLITKRSRKKDKVLQEINYYTHLPRPLSIYFPRMHDFTVGKDVSYTLEYYSYRTLAEYYVFFSFPSSVWSKILDRLLAVHHELTSFRGRAAVVSEVRGFYLGKLLSRMQELPQGSRIHKLAAAERVMLNGVSIPGWQHYLARIEAAVDRIARKPQTGIIHGDLCFSNILYDPQTGLLKLIDPRGDFYDEGCYGDPRYDLAKLLHSFHGGYDFIMQEMYDLAETGTNEFRLRLFRPEDSAQVAQSLISRMAGKVEYDINDLLVLEAMLFLSMLPLHSDDEGRQMALYLTGINILRGVYSADLH